MPQSPETAVVAGGYDRVMAWVLPLVAALTPLVIVVQLVHPHVGQSYFFMLMVLLSLAGLGAAWAMGLSRLPSGITMPFVLFALLALAFVASLTQSQNWVFSVKKALLPLCGFLFFALIVHSPLRRRILDRATVMLILVGTLLAVYGIAQHFGFELLPYSEQVRKNVVIATIGHPNYLSSVLGPIIFLTIAMLYRHRRWSWVVPGMAVIGTLVICLALARTRAIWMGIAVALVVMLMIAMRYGLPRPQGRRMLAALVAGGALQIGLIAVFVTAVLPAFDAQIDFRERIESHKEIKSRMFYWNAAIDLGRERPVLGHGYAMFDPKFWTYTLEHQKSEMGPFYYDILPAISGTNPGHVHNEYLQVYAEHGTVGLVLLLALFGFFLYYGYLRLVREPDTGSGFEQLAVYGALVVFLIDAGLSFPWRLPVSLIVFMIVLARIYDDIYTPDGTGASSGAPEPAAMPQPARAPASA